jgi:hypothetical protein
MFFVARINQCRGVLASDCDELVAVFIDLFDVHVFQYHTSGFYHHKHDFYYDGSRGQNSGRASIYTEFPQVQFTVSAKYFLHRFGTNLNLYLITMIKQ